MRVADVMPEELGGEVNADDGDPAMTGTLRAGTQAGDEVRSARLDLVLFSPALMDAIVAGDRARAQALAPFGMPGDLFPGPPDTAEYYAFRRDQVRRDPSWAPWSQRAIVLRERNALVGVTTFHGPPGVNDTGTPGAAELGYEVFESERGKGFATEAARAMIGWAHAAHGVTHFISGVAPDNAASLRVIAKLGFVATGQIVDGELIFELHVPPVSLER